MLSDGNTKVIQNPQIRAADGQKASLKIGDRVPVATGSYQAGVAATGVSPLVNTQFQYLDVGVNVDITPTIHADRSVTLKISMDVSSVTGSVDIGGISQPVIGQRRIDHEIRLKEGEVNLLGGILEDSDIKAVSGFPGLSNLPLFKYLVSDQHNEKHQNEIVFLVTPHVVRTPEVSASNQMPLLVGTGNTIELQPVDAAPAVATVQPVGAPGAAPAVAPSALVKQTAPQVSPASHASSVAAPVASAAAQTQAAIRPAAIQPATSGPVQLSFNPPQSTTTVGQTFTVEVMVSNARRLFSAPIQLQYDPTKLQVMNTSNGGFLAQGEQVVALAQRDDPATGTLRITAVRPPNSDGSSGSGSLVAVTFLAKADGRTTVSVARAGLRDADQQPVASSGTPAFVEINRQRRPRPRLESNNEGETERLDMAEFIMRLSDERGHVTEQVESAESEAEARERLLQQGRFVVGVKSRGVALGGNSALRKRGKIKLGRFVQFNQQLVTLLRAGLPILTGLDLLAKQQKEEYFRGLLQNVRERVKAGSLLSEAFEHQEAVPKIYTTTLLAGEKSGNLEEVLNRYVHFQRMALSFRKKLKASLIYPTLLVSMVIIMLTFLVTFVVPRFADLYSQLGAELPGLTQFMLAFGVNVHHYWLFLVAGVALLGAVVWRWAGSESGALRIDQVRLALPIVGTIWMKYQTFHVHPHDGDAALRRPAAGSGITNRGRVHPEPQTGYGCGRSGTAGT